MGLINIRFGYPSSLEEQELLSSRAIENDCSIEAALCFEFKSLLNFLVTKKDGDNFFELIFLVITQKAKTAPGIKFGTYYENGHKLPMIVLEDDHLKLSESERLFISNQFVNEFGKIYQTEFDYEYVGFDRV